MFRKHLKSLSILFFTITVLARGVTGAPNAQVEIFNGGLFSQTKTVSTHLVPDRDINSFGFQVQSHEISTHGDGNNSHIKSYKKYVYPDCAPVYCQTSQPTSLASRIPEFRNIWFFSSLPTVIHINAPPMKKATTSHIGNSPLKGALNVEGENSSYSGWRVSLLSSRAPTQ